MVLLVNIDVPALAEAERFYAAAFGLRVARRFGEAAVELQGMGVPVYLLHKVAGTAFAGAATDAGAGGVRSYARHWTPVHCDVVVADLEQALQRAIAAGAVTEGDVGEHAWGRSVQLADPYGHGWCLLQFVGRGYDEIATP